MTLEQLRPYYLGAYYATIAMQKKLKDSSPEGKAFVQEGERLPKVDQRV